MTYHKIYNSEEEVLTTAKKALNIPFGILDKTNKLHDPKGGIGKMLEEGVFNIPNNNISAPDIQNLGIEIKATGTIKNKDGKQHAKERLVLGQINYEKENIDSFENSKFWFKNRHLLIMLYEYLKDGTPDEKWSFYDYINLRYTDEDLKIIKSDWELIANKIKNGKAHEISESDTLYLGACTKAANSKILVKQPYSEIQAKPRAYAFKASYLNSKINDNLTSNDKKESIIKNIDELNNHSFKEIIENMVKPYIGKSQKQLVDLFNIKRSKQTNASIVKAIFKVSCDLDETEEFKKARIIPKTIRIESNGIIKESMSFPTFKFKEIVNQPWEESNFGITLTEGIFLFIIFKKIDSTESNSIFKGIKFYSLPEDDLLEAKRCFEETKNIIRNGVNLKKTSKGYTNNLPSITSNFVSHVRPHASKAYYKFDSIEIGNHSDGDELPDGRWMTKQCFWLNRDYIKKVVGDYND